MDINNDVRVQAQAYQDDGFQIPSEWGRNTSIKNSTWIHNNQTRISNIQTDSPSTCYAVPSNDDSRPFCMDSFFPTSIDTQIFHPVRFFRSGLGQVFQNDLHKHNYNKSRFVRYQKDFCNSSSGSSSPSPSSNSNPSSPGDDCCYSSAIFYHIHKNGGSTMARTKFQNFPNVEIYYAPMQKRIGKYAYDNVTAEILRNVCFNGQQPELDIEWLQQQKQEQQESKQHEGNRKPNSILQSSPSRSATSLSIQKCPCQTVPIFTFIRDPAIRFLSSLGQAVSSATQKFISCQAETSKFDFVDCVLTKMESHGYLNEHLQPQSYELYHGMKGYDLGVVLIDMKSNFDAVLEQVMGVGNTTLLKRRQSRTGYMVLEKFSLDEEVSIHFLDRICRLYEADVLMIREIGVTTTLCP